MSLEVAEENTKIRRKYLEALENENFGILPGRVYVKGFLKNYAGFLGLDADALVEAYDQRDVAAEKEDDKDPNRLTRIERPAKSPIWKIALGLLGVAVLAYLYLPSVIGAGKDTDIKPPAKNGNNVLGQNDKGQDTGQGRPIQEDNAPPTPKGVNLTLNVTDNLSWMYVEIDGRPAYTGFMESGQVKEFKGTERIYVKLGNAGVVEVEFNGQKIGVLGQRGEVVNKEFTVPQG